MKCLVCDKDEPSFAWTDTHGVAQCLTCGTPYVLYHYEGKGANRRRVEKPPECYVLEPWIPLLRAYWKDRHLRIPSGCSFQGGQELATVYEADAFIRWVKEHKHEYITEHAS